MKLFALIDKVVQVLLGVWIVLVGCNTILGAEISSPGSAGELFVSPQGQDANPGTAAAPLQSFAAAQQAARRLAARGPVTVTFADGVYYLPQTVMFTPADSGTAAAPVVYNLRALFFRFDTGAGRCLVEP